MPSIQLAQPVPSFPASDHDHFWTSRGFQVIRPRERTPIASHVAGYLLIGSDASSVFNPGHAIDLLRGNKHHVILLRLHHTQIGEGRERIVTDEHHRFIRFHRLDESSVTQPPQRAALTTSRRIANLWRQAPDSRTGWRRLRRLVPPADRVVISMPIARGGKALNRRIPHVVETWHAWPHGPKRAFDVIFALAAVIVTAPLYPLVMLAIFLDDGRPFFFLHTRESRGGVEFSCIKFRTMKKNAERIKRDIQQQNHSDGPHFFIERDPRLTRVGYFLRKFNIDELPQFFNVLLGHMSVVGPRPSPRRENQYCPAWREARLSVRPGVTGLWQVKRSRRPGLDFQEWIRYDIEYVDRLSWPLDLHIIWRTILTVLRLPH